MSALSHLLDPLSLPVNAPKLMGAFVRCRTRPVEGYVELVLHAARWWTFAGQPRTRAHWLIYVKPLGSSNTVAFEPHELYVVSLLA